MGNKKNHSKSKNNFKRRKGRDCKVKKKLNNLPSKIELKDLRIVLHDIAADGLIPTYQQYLITKKNNFEKVIVNCKKNANKTINTNKNIERKIRKSSINHDNKLLYSTVKINEEINKISVSKKKKIKKKLFIDTKSPYTKEQEICFVKPLSSDCNDNKKENDFNKNNKNKLTDKDNNLDTYFVKIHSDSNLFNDISNNKSSISDIDNKNESKEDKLNCKENSMINFFNNDNCIENKHSDEITCNKFTEELTCLPLISKDINKILNITKSNETKELPVIIEDTTLHNNKIILLNHKEKVDNIEINKPSSVELLNEVTEFTDNYQENQYQKLQIDTSLNITDMTENTSESNSTISSKKRTWLSQNGVTQFDNTCNKKFKLDRSFLKKKNLNTTNSIPFINNNSNSFSKCDNVNINDNSIQNIDNYITFSYNNNNNNTLCKVQNIPKLIEIDSNTNISNSLESLYDLERENNVYDSSTLILDLKNEMNILKINNKNSETIFDFGNEKNESKLIKECSTKVDNFEEDNLYKKDEISVNNVQLDHKRQIEDKTQDDNDDDDCISIYSNMSLFLDDTCMSCYNNVRTNELKNNKITHNTSDTSKQHNNLKCIKELDTIAKSDIPINNKLINSQDQNEHKKIKENVSSMKIISMNTNKSIISINNNISVKNKRKRKRRVKNNNNNSWSNNNNNAQSTAIISDGKNNNSLPNNNYNAYSTDIISNGKNVVQNSEKINMFLIHKRYCPLKMRNAQCTIKNCCYDHRMEKLIDDIVNNYKKYLTNILFHLCTLRYTYFVENLYIRTIDELDTFSILKIFKKVCSQERPYLPFISSTVEGLLNKGMSSKIVISNLCNIIHNDNLTLHYILISIKPRIKSSEYWDTLSTLFKYIKPDKEIIEEILNDCIIKSKTQKYIQDVNKILINKLCPDEINQLDENLLSSFKNLLLQDKYKNDNNKSYISHSVNDLSEQCSLYRNKSVNSNFMLSDLKNKLLLKDYDYVINTLTNYQKMDEARTLCYHCCFQIFCQEIYSGEYYLSEIIKRAIKTGAIDIVNNVLLDFAIYILMKLAINEIWILAYNLLETLQIFNVDHDAMFLLLSAEIYLANNQLDKAFVLLKESNIISSNRQYWNVVSKSKDFYRRNKIIKILLDALCKVSSEKAFFMFKFLANDQNNIYKPIDLSKYVDKLILQLLTENKIELIAAMGRLIIKHNFTFNNKITCRAVLVTLVRNDDMLAEGLYRYASVLGIYRTIELSSNIHVRINVDWVKEEICLIFMDLFQRLSLNIGHNINSIKPEELSIYIIFEDIPAETHLYYENFYDSNKVEKVNLSKKLVREVLHEQISPLLSLEIELNGNIMKLNTCSVVNYLKFVFDNYIMK